MMEDEGQDLLTLRMTREVFEGLREIFAANPRLAVSRADGCHSFVDLSLDEAGRGSLTLSASVFTEEV